MFKKDNELIFFKETTLNLRGIRSADMNFKLISSFLLGLYSFFSLYILLVTANVGAQSETYSLAAHAEPVNSDVPPVDIVHTAASEAKLLRRAQILKRGPPWTTEEVELLLKLKAEGKSWNEIKEYFPTRSIGSLNVKYTRSFTLSKEIKLPWTAKEDDYLVEGLKSGMTYEEMSQVLSRSKVAIADRVRRLKKLNRLSQVVRNRRYTDADYELMREMREKGKTWKEIGTEYFPGRPVWPMRTSYLNNQKKKQQREKED